MRIFTNGKLTVLLTPTHVYRWMRDGDHRVEKRRSAATEFDPSGVLLLDSAGQDLAPTYAGCFEEKTLLDCGLVDDERAAFLHGDQTLTWGPPPTEGWARTVDLAKHRGSFPKWAAGLRLGPREAKDDLDEEEQEHERERAEKRATGFPHGTLVANAFGLGVASNFSGNVALYRADAAEPALTFRLGMAEEDRVYARPTKKGLLLTVVFNGRYSTVFHVDEKGKLLAHLPEEPSGRPPALAMKRFAVDFVDTTVFARNAKLEPVASLEVGMRPVIAAESADGRHFAIADCFGGDMALFSLSAKGELREVDRVSYAGLRREAKAATDRKDADRAYFLRRVPGEACVGFAAKPVASPPWTIRTGEFVLPLVVRSAGGVGRGLAVRLSGPAIEDLKLERASVHAYSAPFRPDGDGLRAELPDVELPEGVVLPLDPKPTNDSQKAAADALVRETHLDLVVHGHAARASSAILRVEIGALGASSSPLKWMRPLVVQDR